MHNLPTLSMAALAQDELVKVRVNKHIPEKLSKSNQMLYEFMIFRNEEWHCDSRGYRKQKHENNM